MKVMKRIVLSISIVFILVLQIVSSIYSQTRQNLELIVATGQPNEVSVLAFSPDGKILASGSLNSITLFETTSGRELKTISGHKSFVTSLTFSPSGEILASSSYDKTIKLWDLNYGKERNSLLGSDSPIYSLAFSKDGRLLASGNGRGGIELWDVELEKAVKTLQGDALQVYSLVFSADGNSLISAYIGGFADSWAIKTGTRVRVFSPQSPNGLNYRWPYPQSIRISPDGNKLAKGNDSKTDLWDISSNWKMLTEGEPSERVYGPLVGAVRTTRSELSGDRIEHAFAVAFSQDSRLVASGSKNNINLINTDTSQSIANFKTKGYVTSVAFSANGKLLAAGTSERNVSLWNVETQKEIRTLSSRVESAWPLIFSRNGELIAHGNKGKIKLWDLISASEVKTVLADDKQVNAISFSPDGQLLAAAGINGLIIRELKSETSYKLAYNSWVSSLSFSLNGSVLAYAINNTILLVNVNEKRVFMELSAESGRRISSLVFSKDGQLLVSGDKFGTIEIWDINLGKKSRIINYQEDPGKIRVTTNDGSTRFIQVLADYKDEIISMVLSPNEEHLATETRDEVKVWDIGKGEEINRLQKNTFEFAENISLTFPDYFKFDNQRPMNANKSLQAKQIEVGKLGLFDVKTGKHLVTLVSIDDNDWIVTTPEGKFDTNKSLDRIEGLHWVVNEEILRPLPLEIFSRQYYEPNLLARLLKCTEENNCDKEFKPLPSIAEINRVQPNVKIKEVKPVANSTDLADVTIEVENVTNELSLSVTDKTQTKQLSSGVYDLRLFRDGQLVGVSTPRNKLAQFIADAPRLVAENKASGKLIDTPENKAWREANDIFKIKAENVKQVSPTTIEYTFRNVKLPRDGRKEVEFTAYAFNSDKVKSTTTEPFKFTIPNAVSNAPKKGRAVVVSIGVNASENPAYALRYAANDARKMQEVVGERLKKNLDKYSEVVQIPLISDYGKDGNLSENTAQKAIIRGVFSLLSGNQNEVPENILRQIPNREKIKPIEPEDTLLITFSGHGYTDQSGIFYVLPYDIGKETTKLTPEVLQKTISSDELSLWMQDITAAEMIMIIDACHSSAAVQGDGFKPGPMGSRGLGQLAYDKDMKILSATQADNVALELGSLQQGLLSYALIQDGIVESKADADKDKQLFSTEWLSYAERRVPELYQEVKDGKRGVYKDGILVQTKGTEVISLDGKLKSNLNLQQPSLFDFKRRSLKQTLLNLP